MAAAKTACEAAKASSDLAFIELQFDAARAAMWACGVVKTANAAKAARIAGDYSMAAHELECVARYTEQCAHYMHEIAARLCSLAS